ncbi:MAG: methylmalonyl-CoA mutase family protein, partial [Flavobacteriaceae bacterium]
MSEHSLFSAFPPVSAKAWKQKIQVDLKGADYNETLVWESPEGINVKPFYSQEDLEGKSPAIEFNPSSWYVGQRIETSDPLKMQELCIDALKGGAEHLIVHLKSNEFDLDVLMSDPGVEGSKLLIEADQWTPDTLHAILKNTSAKHNNIILYDVIGQLAASGNWHNSFQDDFDSLEALLADFPDTKIVAVNGALYQNSGADRIQELAYMIAHAKEYINRLHTKGLRHITFNTSTSSNYFFEIAKLKALRLLWQSLLKKENKSLSYHILCSPSKRNKSIYDYNVNMLRSTTESMAAILGGADTIYNLPYDNMYHKQNDFADR